MSLVIEDKTSFKQEVKALFSQIIPKPNKDVLSVTVVYDPNLDVITVRYNSLSKDKNVLVLDEEIGAKGVL